ncbi:hypothetical protein ES703_38698 [subsurface metagenome]
MSDENSNKQSHTAVDKVDLQTEMAKAQVEIAKIQAETNSGWQTVFTTLANMWEKHDAQKASGERRYTNTLTIGILVFLVIIVGTLSALTWRGSVSGDSLIFFLGTLAGSVLMLVAERIKTQR